MNMSPLTPTCKHVESMVENMAQAYAQTQQTMSTLTTQNTLCASQLMQVTSAYMPMLAKAPSLPDATYTMATLFGAYTHIMQQAFINQTRACGHLMQHTQTMAQRNAAMPWFKTNTTSHQPTPQPSSSQTLSQRIAQRLAERRAATPAPVATSTQTKAKPKQPKSANITQATPSALLVAGLAAKAQLEAAQRRWNQSQNHMAIAAAECLWEHARTVNRKPARPAPVQAKVEITTVADTADAMTHFPVPPTLPSAYPMVSPTAQSVMRPSHHNVAAARSAHARGVRQSVMARRSARIVKVAR